MRTAMSKDAHSTKLPDDLAQCHALICELLAVKDELAASMRQQELENEAATSSMSVTRYHGSLAFLS